MKTPLLVILILAGVAAIAATRGEQSPAQTQPTTQPTTAPAIKKQLPLLLEDEDDGASLMKKPVADNSRCHVCHLNFETEHLSLSHAKANVGCAACHGESDAHIADESWASGGNGTAPDMMYPAEKINPSCLECHAKEKLSGESHKPFLAGVTKEKLCTECHGKHRMVNRKCKWK